MQTSPTIFQAALSRPRWLDTRRSPSSEHDHELKAGASRFEVLAQPTSRLPHHATPIWTDHSTTIAEVGHCFAAFALISQDVLEAYERLIHDAMSGDHTLFTTAEGIERLWDLSTTLLEAPPPARAHAPGSWGLTRSTN